MAVASAIPLKAYRSLLAIHIDRDSTTSTILRAERSVWLIGTFNRSTTPFPRISSYVSYSTWTSITLAVGFGSIVPPR
jgi:hypothetical protein